MFSPHTRGWPVLSAQSPSVPSRSPRTRGDGPQLSSLQATQKPVLPAHAGMARRGRCRWRPGGRSPRTRGDGPNGSGAGAGGGRRSPRTRGDGPGGQGHCPADHRVLPAHAGMARIKLAPAMFARAFSPHTRGWPAAVQGLIEPHETFSPHTRGWPVIDHACRLPAGEFSPHTRGWPVDRLALVVGHTVLPAHAGMARGGTVDGGSGPSSPRTRGDGPTKHRSRWCRSKFSPHTRGWPALAPLHQQSAHRSPRTRGDGPLAGIWRLGGPGVLPAHAGMARLKRLKGSGLLHVLPAHAGMARQPRHSRTMATAFSPHTRGWPTSQGRGYEGEVVLPAHAGMARLAPNSLWQSLRFSPHTRGWPEGTVGGGLVLKGSPRTRGDGPRAALPFLVRCWFSPHTRGWPAWGPLDCADTRRSPRTRGDGPIPCEVLA